MRFFNIFNLLCRLHIDCKYYFHRIFDFSFHVAIGDGEYLTSDLNVDENKEFRDEFAGSTSGSVCFAASVYMEVIEIGDNSFKGKVLKKAVVGNSTHFEENQVVTVIYSKSTNENLHTLLIEDLSVGEKVYVFYGKIESGTIYTPRIRYEKF